MLNLTFTGVDERTNLDDLLDIRNRYPEHVEFAVLVGSKTTDDYRQDSGRYPCLTYVWKFRDFCRRYNTRCAIHLCGKYARDA